MEDSVCLLSLSQTTDTEKDMFDVIHKGETQISRQSVEGKHLPGVFYLV